MLNFDEWMKSDINIMVVIVGELHSSYKSCCDKIVIEL